MGHVLVAEHQNLGLREPCAVDDRGVIQRVRDDEIIFAQHGRHGPRIRRKARLKDHAPFDILEARNLLLEFQVDLHRPGNGAHRTRPHAISLRRLQCRLAQLRMRRQPQIIVRR